MIKLVCCCNRITVVNEILCELASLHIVDIIYTYKFVYRTCTAFFFLPTDTGTHSIGKNSLKIKQIGNFLPVYW